MCVCPFLIGTPGPHETNINVAQKKIKFDPKSTPSSPTLSAKNSYFTYNFIPSVTKVEETYQCGVIYACSF